MDAQQIKQCRDTLRDLLLDEEEWEEAMGQAGGMGNAFRTALAVLDSHDALLAVLVVFLGRSPWHEYQYDEFGDYLCVFCGAHKRNDFSGENPPPVHDPSCVYKRAWALVEALGVPIQPLAAQTMMDEGGLRAALGDDVVDRLE